MVSMKVELAALLLLACCLVNGAAAGEDEDANKGKHPVFFSEIQLRNFIVESNSKLAELKGEFTKNIVRNYLEVKANRRNGFLGAKRGGTAGLAMTLMAEEYSNIEVKQYIIQRRLVSGLRVAFHKLLPIRTLEHLIEKFDQSYAWLKDLNQINLQPEFPTATDKQFVKLYNIIKLRAQLRASDDVVALTSDNIRRIFKVIKWFLIDRKAGKDLSNNQFEAMSEYAQTILKYYLENVIVRQKELAGDYKRLIDSAGDLKKLAGGEKELVAFVDKLIDGEALDIDLSKEATGMKLPPTINESMIKNIRKLWIPREVLSSVAEDRKILLQAKDAIKNFVKLEGQDRDVDAESWCSRVYKYLSEQAYGE